MQYTDTTRENAAGSGPENAEPTLRKKLDLLSCALEREHRAREAAEAASQLKSRQLAELAHDLRSPLNAILGWTQLLALKCPGDPQVAAILPRIENSARAQIKILNDIDGANAA